MGGGAVANTLTCTCANGVAGTGIS
eukprot:SAG31_NODE_1841_length_7117_cov_12.976207_9_plen_24_part_01